MFPCLHRARCVESLPQRRDRAAETSEPKGLRRTLNEASGLLARRGDDQTLTSVLSTFTQLGALRTARKPQPVLTCVQACITLGLAGAFSVGAPPACQRFPWDADIDANFIAAHPVVIGSLLEEHEEELKQLGLAGKFALASLSGYWA